jgi:hypothetical protein
MNSVYIEVVREYCKVVLERPGIGGIVAQLNVFAG